MAWNEPGKNDEQDPWSGRKRKEQEPPDLERLIGQFFKRFFGGNSGGGWQGSNGAASQKQGKFLLLGVVLAIVVIWAASGFFIVQPAEKAVILRFGRYVETVGEGPHWIPRFVESAIVRDTTKLEKFTYSAHMLTMKTNIIFADISVQYRISNLKDYLFTNTDPNETLYQAAASALRQVIGQSDLDTILTTGRSFVRQRTQELLEEIISKYHVGIEVKEVLLLSARVPEPVRDAFDEAIRASEIEVKYKNEAEGYRSAMLPKAKGDAKRLLADAEAYQAKVTLAAQGDVARFNALLPQYQAAPRVTRERMYLDALESVLEKTSKVLVDTDGSNNILYLPIDKLISQAKLTPSTTDETAGLAANAKSQADPVGLKLTKGDPRSRYQYSRQNYRGRGES